LSLVAASCVALLNVLKSELAPVEDRGMMLGVFSARMAQRWITPTSTPARSRDLQPDQGCRTLFRRFRQSDGQPGHLLRRSDRLERAHRRSPDIAKELFPKFMAIPGVLAFPVTPPSLGQSPRERPVNFVIVTSASYEELQQVTSQFLAELAKNPGLTNVDTDLKLNKPELSVEVKRDKAADIGVPVETIGRTLETLLGGRQVTRFKREGEQYDVIVQVAKRRPQQPPTTSATSTPVAAMAA
jgi:multidrug efflux pump